MSDARPGVDMHAHLLVPEVEALVRTGAGRTEELREQTRAMGRASVEHHLSLMDRYLPQLTDRRQRIADMDAAGIDLQVLSISPTQCNYWADAELGADRVVLGSDHPFDMGVEQPLELLAACSGLTDEQRAVIAGRNALQILGVPT